MPTLWTVKMVAVRVRRAERKTAEEAVAEVRERREAEGTGTRSWKARTKECE